MSPSTEPASIASLWAVIDLVALICTVPAPEPPVSSTPTMPSPASELIVPFEPITIALSPEAIWATMPAVALPLLVTAMSLFEVIEIAPLSEEAPMPTLSGWPSGLSLPLSPVTLIELPVPVVMVVAPVWPALEVRATMPAL